MRSSKKDSGWWLSWSIYVKKCAQVKLDHFPRDRGETKKRLKAPPKRSWKLRSHISYIQAFMIQQRSLVLFSHKRKKNGPKSISVQHVFCDHETWEPRYFKPFQIFSKKKSPTFPQHSTFPPRFVPKKKGPAHPKSKASQEHSTLRHRVHLMGVENPPRCRMLQLPKT